MMTMVLAAMQSAFLHVPMSVMPATWVSISVYGSGGGVRGVRGGGSLQTHTAACHRTAVCLHTFPACMVREEEGEWEVCGERGLGGGAGERAREEGRA
jgi:hypothetical protein